MLEYFVAMSVGLLVLTAAVAFWAFAAKTCASLLGYVELSNKSKIAMDTISQQIRNAKRVKSCSTSALVLSLPGTNSDTVTYSYNSTDQKLAQSFYVGGVTSTSILLSECTNFQFYIYQRTPISNSFELYTNGFSTNSVKVVLMQWTCVRKVTGDKNSVESQVSSKVVIRNQ